MRDGRWLACVPTPHAAEAGWLCCVGCGLAPILPPPRIKSSQLLATAPTNQSVLSQEPFPRKRKELPYEMVEARIDDALLRFYDGSKQFLSLRFHNTGDVYRYFHFPAAEYQAFLGAEWAGFWLSSPRSLPLRRMANIPRPPDFVTTVAPPATSVVKTFSKPLH